MNARLAYEDEQQSNLFVSEISTLFPKACPSEGTREAREKRSRSCNLR